MAIGTAVAAAVIGLCCGCATAVTGHGKPSADVIAAPPEKGSCWKLRTLDFGTALDQPKRTACTQPHDTETVWTVTDAVPLSTPYPTEAQTEDTSGVVGTAVDDACSSYTVSTYLGDEAQRYTPFVIWMPHLPSRAQWAAGARWMRCDVVYGVDAPETAPARLINALTGPKKAAFRACYAGSPSSNRFVACSRPHEAEIVTSGLSLPDDTAFPTDAPARHELAEAGCGEDLDFALAQGPRPPGLELDLYLESSDPSPGQFTVSCVLVRLDGQESTTLVLP